MSSDTDLHVGRELRDHEDARKTVQMSSTLPRFWCVKRVVMGLPIGVRPWSVWDRRPQYAQVIYDPHLLEQNTVLLRYADGETVEIHFNDYLRCGTIIEDSTKVTKIFTQRMEGERDLLGQMHP